MEISERVPEEAEKREYPIDVTDAEGVNVMEVNVRSAPPHVKRTSLR